MANPSTCPSASTTKAHQTGWLPKPLSIKCSILTVTSWAAFSYTASSFISSNNRAQSSFTARRIIIFIYSLNCEFDKQASPPAPFGRRGELLGLAITYCPGNRGLLQTCQVWRRYVRHLLIPLPHLPVH